MKRRSDIPNLIGKLFSYVLGNRFDWGNVFFPIFLGLISRFLEKSSELLSKVFTDPLAYRVTRELPAPVREELPSVEDLQLT